MAKNKRIALGNVMNPSKEDKEGNKIPSDKQVRYVKVNLPRSKEGKPLFPQGVQLMDGDVIRLESTNFQKVSLNEAVQGGKVTEELGDKIIERLNKRPEFVFGEAILVIKEE